MAVVVAGLRVGRLRRVGLGLWRGRGGARSGVGGAALDDLVELAAVEPDAAALRAIVDLDALPVAHRQPDLADGAEHRGNGGGIAHRTCPFVGELMLSTWGRGHRGSR